MSDQETGPERVRVRVVVSGRVQGVLFRDTCRREAAARDVSGWVRNAPDGTVEAEFEGRPDDVDAMVAWAREGPPFADVRDVATEPVPVTGEHGFSLR